LLLELTTPSSIFGFDDMGLLPTLRSVRDGILTGLFLLVLFLPVCLTGIAKEKMPGGLEEKRTLAELPRTPNSFDAIKAFPRRFEAYYNDHFHFRDVLIRSHNRLKLKILKKSPNRNVLIGKNGWLFFARDHLLEDFISIEPFAKEALTARQRYIEAKRDWLASRGIPYFFVVAPNKQSIYPEQMPESYYRSHGPSHLDQLIEHMRNFSDVNIIDLRVALREAKAGGQLYFSTDTHWNHKGAFTAYRHIMEILQQSTSDNRQVLQSFTDYQAVAATRKGGDLAKMLGVADDIQERYDRLDPSLRRCAQEEALSNYMDRDWKPFPDPVAYTCSSASLRLVMLHDSFGNGIRPYLAENFRKSVFVRQHQLPGDVFKAIVLKEKPDLVVEEIVERMVYYMKDSPELLP
jgi:alginate O-acetyltransferase complex protein AlgJ